MGKGKRILIMLRPPEVISSVTEVTSLIETNIEVHQKCIRVCICLSLSQVFLFGDFGMMFLMTYFGSRVL